VAIEDETEKPARLQPAWVILTFFAVANGVWGLRYALPHIPLPTLLPNFSDRRGWLIAHAVFSSVALLAGPWQFLAGFRSRRLNAHRWLGRIYCAAVAAGWAASLPIAAHAQTGALASSGFLSLGGLWIGTTVVGYRTIRQGRVQEHREWMLRSYALCAAAITLRMYLPLTLVTHVPFAIGYGAVAWICWIPNLILAEWLVQRRRARPAAPGTNTDASQQLTAKSQ
jgi:uncharacterized membrane protein